MTVVLHFYGGPRDGGWRRTSSKEHATGEAIIRREARGYYTSIVPWEGADIHVELVWFYGTPEFHETMKNKG